MAGYLDNYGAGHEQKSKRNKTILIVLAAIIVTGASLYFGLRNYRQKSKIKEFVELLQKHEYPSAYTLWGCSEAKPCKDYDYNRFLGDWGPQSPKAQIASYGITRARACGSGVIVTVDFGQNREERFWVENRDMIIGYFPWSVCPAR